MIQMRADQLNEDMVALIPGQITMKEETELTMYIITQWAIVHNNQTGVKMVIVLKRRIMNELLTTYLPSVLLILITYATTFFKPFFFESALGVNLTTMLVMTTIFIAVMDKLPSTAYVKMVDYWLIFGQLIPFIEVVLLTAMEYNREGDGSGEGPPTTQTINHHGEGRVIRLDLFKDKVGLTESEDDNLIKTNYRLAQYRWSLYRTTLLRKSPLSAFLRQR